jgi:hypothetical protein
MNAKELADELEKDIHWIQDELARKWVVDMLRQQQAELDRAVELYTDKAIENEALKMGFAGNGTSDSELAEVRAQANRWFLKIKEQQAEIEALKQIIDANNLSQNIGQFVKPANEPVAWMFQGAFDISTYVSFEKPNPDIYPNPTPLYTHPVKELTDEEIIAVGNAVVNLIDSNEGWLEFARAILRKAQENG